MKAANAFIERDYVKNRANPSRVYKANSHARQIKLDAAMMVFLDNGGKVQALGVSATRNEAHTHTARGHRDPSGKYGYGR